MTPEERKQLNEILQILPTPKEMAYRIPVDSGGVGEELAYIKICVQYILFDNEATHREFEELKKIVS